MFHCLKRDATRSRSALEPYRHSFDPRFDVELVVIRRRP